MILASVVTKLGTCDPPGISHSTPPRLPFRSPTICKFLKLTVGKYALIPFLYTILARRALGLFYMVMMTYVGKYIVDRASEADAQLNKAAFCLPELV
jgi:hypothetical protein